MDPEWPSVEVLLADDALWDKLRDQRLSGNAVGGDR
jgi:hypothetical protein